MAIDWINWLDTERKDKYKAECADCWEMIADARLRGDKLIPLPCNECQNNMIKKLRDKYPEIYQQLRNSVTMKGDEVK